MKYIVIVVLFILIEVIYLIYEFVSNRREKYYANVGREFTKIISGLSEDEKEIVRGLAHYASTCKFKKTPIQEFKDDIVEMLDYFKKNDIASDDLIVKIITIVF